MIVLLYNFFCRSLRYAAYLQFCWQIQARLGKDVRRIIQACVVKKIREEYPSANGCYIWFHKKFEVSQTRCSWVTEIDQRDFSYSFGFFLGLICFTSHRTYINQRHETFDQGRNKTNNKKYQLQNDFENSHFWELGRSNWKTTFENSSSLKNTYEEIHLFFLKKVGFFN